MILKFLGVASFAATIISLGSLWWPKFTQQARPVPLQQVHDLVIKTDLGKQAAGILGVTDESGIEPINVASLAGEVVNDLLSNAQQKAQEVIITQTVKQLLQQIDQLTPEQKQQIQQTLCKP